ncbi:MAG: zinc ribbon domain-containing protein [bacterium]|nr:zinc ribbon domain-containing protein [bacterium]
MPIYEFYCADCNALFNFFSARIDTEKRPNCPRCGRLRLERRPASFATLRHGSSEDSDEPLDRLDDSALENAMESMAAELETLGDSEDPKQFARVLRRMGQSTGLEMGPKMEELLGRLESGADLDDLEAEMDSLDTESGEGSEFDDFFRLKKRIAMLRERRPRVDTELYFL